MNAVRERAEAQIGALLFKLRKFGFQVGVQQQEWLVLVDQEEAAIAEHVRGLLSPDEATIEVMAAAWLGGVLNCADAEECCRLMLDALLRKAGV